MDRIYRACYPSDIGAIEIAGTDRGILSIGFDPAAETPDEHLPPCVSQGLKQLDEYFKGRRRQFDLPLILEGTDFQKTVWRELTRIPYASTRSYGDVAAAIGKPKACRAVGQANHNNPIAIVVPCHRVIGADGSLTGYGSGIWRKKWLLSFESAARDNRVSGRST